MARFMVSKRRRRLFLMLDGVRCVLTTITLIVVLIYLHFCSQYRKRILRSPSYFTNEGRRIQLQNIIFHDDTTCINQLRMNRATFNKLCSMLRTFGKLSDSPNVTVEEMTAMFVHILAHHVKNRVIINKFMRSGETISRHFNSVLKGIIRLQSHLLKNPVAVSENSTDNRWKWFKNCLGALDGTYIRMHVLEEDKPRYRTRKGDIATNVLGVCSQDMQFIFIYPGWEGSAADSRVLRDAISRRHGLKVPRGYYYLVDAGYLNGEGFLAPYRGQRYHLNDWRHGHQPTTPQELFNMKHSSARNVIERCFGLLKRRWAILRSPSFYPVKTQNRIIIACALLHNHIAREMPADLLLDIPSPDNYVQPIGDPYEYVNVSDEWQHWRDNLSQTMFDAWMASRNVPIDD